MEKTSDYNIEVESILGGLESALARGQPLKKAMISFRNAGYKEKNIREAARKFQVLHKRTFQELGVDPNKPKRIVGAVSPSGTQESKKQEKEETEIKKPKELVPVQIRERLMEQYEREKREMESKKQPAFSRKILGKKPEDQEVTASEEDKSEEDIDLEAEQALLEKTAAEAPSSPEEKEEQKDQAKLKKTQEKRKKQDKSDKTTPLKKNQVVSGYGDESVLASENFKAAIEEAVKSLSRLTATQPTSKRTKKQKPQVITKVSNYGMKPPTPVNKAVTFLLIFLLILLLGVLAAIFFFREELIDLFNTLVLE